MLTHQGEPQTSKNVHPERIRENHSRDTAKSLIIDGCVVILTSTAVNPDTLETVRDILLSAYGTKTARD